MSEVPLKSRDEKNTRHLQLQAWATKALSNVKSVSGTDVHFSALSGDAGFRRYYRITGSQPPMLAVDAPPETEKNHAFCHIAQLFRQQGIHAPQIYAVDYALGFMLVEDMGDVMYSPLLEKSKLADKQENKGAVFPHHRDLYRSATRCLLRMATIPVEDSGLERYDPVKLQQEMDLFPQWFVKTLLQKKIMPEAEMLLHNASQLLIGNAIEQPQVVVHRDFHCRNLIYTPNNDPGVIDFQDAVIGPVTYDLVSLYRDCYIDWPEQDVKQWAMDYRQELLEQKRIPVVSEQVFLRWFDWMGLQRHIKVLGIFARLYLRDGKSAYLRDLPLVIHYTLSVAKKYEEFSAFVFWFEQELLPSIKKCDWYRDISA